MNGTRCIGHCSKKAGFRVVRQVCVIYSPSLCLRNPDLRGAGKLCRIHWDRFASVLVTGARKLYTGWQE